MKINYETDTTVSDKQKLVHVCVEDVGFPAPKQHTTSHAQLLGCGFTASATQCEQVCRV